MPYVIGLLIVLAIANLMFYGFMSVVWFIADYWSFALMIVFGMAFMGAFAAKSNMSVKLTCLSLTLVFSAFTYGDSWYISDKEAAAANAYAKQLKFFSGAKIKGNADVVVELPLPSVVYDIVDFEDDFDVTMEKVMESMLGPRSQYYMEYRTLDNEIKEFYENGGSYKVYYLDSDRRARYVFELYSTDDFSLNEVDEDDEINEFFKRKQSQDEIVSIKQAIEYKWNEENSNSLSGVDVFEKDFNNDGYVDFATVSSDYCGTQGCTFEIYAKVNDEYCFVGVWVGDEVENINYKETFHCNENNHYLN